MELQITIPSEVGQICQILNPLNDESPLDVYIVAEDPTPFDLQEDIYVVNLRDLQRNIKNPLSSPQIAIQKSDLNVIAADLEEYIKRWNN